MILNNNWDADIYKERSNIMKRMVLDVGFHMLIKGAWLTLIMAVFIVSYIDLKQSHELLVYDSVHRCYICHLDRDVFHKFKLDFKKHTNNEHMVLNYIYFIMYILTKNPQNLSKIEKFVLDKFRIADYHWIPSKDTTVLQEAIRKIQEKKTRITSEFTLGTVFQQSDKN